MNTNLPYLKHSGPEIDFDAEPDEHAQFLKSRITKECEALYTDKAQIQQCKLEKRKARKDNRKAARDKRRTDRRASGGGLFNKLGNLFQGKSVDDLSLAAEDTNQLIQTIKGGENVDDDAINTAGIIDHSRDNDNYNLDKGKQEDKSALLYIVGGGILLIIAAIAFFNLKK